jgi:hypothetical protein
MATATTMTDMRVRSRWDMCPTFRFLDLPKEIRLMVYERLPREVHEETVVVDDDDVDEDEGDEDEEGEVAEREPRTIKYLRRTTTVSVLCVCKLVYEEAKPIVQRTIEDFILKAGDTAIWVDGS